MKTDDRPTAAVMAHLRAPLRRLGALATGVLLLLDGSAAAAQQAPPDAPHARRSPAQGDANGEAKQQERQRSRDQQRLGELGESVDVRS